ncbi:MAG: class I adenylate-forming enzyme family protein [Eubacteriales bacterium]|nr:class I adenylate-forming enzyme family protein [Eubacteriales bacterium]
MPITDYLERNAKEFPFDISLVEINPEAEANARHTWKEFELIEPNPHEAGRKEITWKEFDISANRFANLLLTRGVKKGDKIAILMMNCIEWLPVYFGILKTGALAVPLNFRYTADEIKYCLKKADCSGLVFGPEFVGRMESICDLIPKVRTMLYVGEDCPTFADSYDQCVQYCSEKKPAITITDNDDGAIYFSSGTTGFPKAILHKHLSLTHAARCEQNHHKQTRNDVFLCIPPLYHTGAKMHWFGSLFSGSKAVILKGTKPEYILKAASDERCTIVWLLVPWAQDILDSIDSGQVNLKEYQLDQWRLMHIGAQPVPPSLVKRWNGVFPHHEYDTNYGLSESIGPGCVHLGLENVHKVGAIGKAGYGWKTRIVDPEKNDVKPGTVGELAVSGPGVMTCYYNDPEATEEVLQEGWLFTGDMAKMDEDDFIYLVDRKKDVIISGGENIYPVQIEDFLRKHEDIKDVAVIGFPDPRLGEIAAAIIELKEGRDLYEEAIEVYCMDLPRYKRPRVIIFADIPRNPTGKIEKPLLRKRYNAENIVSTEV